MLVSNDPSHRISETAWAVLAHELTLLIGASWLGCKIPRPVILIGGEVIWRRYSFTCFTPNISGLKDLSKSSSVG